MVLEAQIEILWQNCSLLEEMTGVKTEVEETMAIEIGGLGMSVIEANVLRGSNGATKVIVGNVATAKVAKEVIEVIAKGNCQALTRARDSDLISCLLTCKVTSC